MQLRRQVGQVRLALVVGLLLLSNVTMTAQDPGAAASVRGRVVDQQERGVVAHVVVTELRTNLAREATTDPGGYFNIPSIPPGDVTVVVTAPGFAEWRAERLRLEVGRVAELDVALSLAASRETVQVQAGAGTVDRMTSMVGSVVSAAEIESLPLNGRNFLELTFLTPGSAPAPSFDPTKAQSVVISSAGQLGRGGNIMIDGMDNNDDVVGGPLMNVTEDAIQEFQVATNRFAAEFGRSASSVVNVITRSGGATMSGTAALYLRDARWQALPATVEPDLAQDPPFDRQQASFTLGGPLGGGLFGFGAVEVRNQDGGILVGERDTNARTIRRTFAPAPLDDWLVTTRVDWRARDTDQLMVRYSGQRQDDVSASTIERAIGSASQRQQSRTRLHGVLGSWTRVASARAVNTFSVSVSDFDNRITPVAPGVQYTFPSLQAGSSFRVPQGTLQRRWQLANTLSLSRGAHQWKLGAHVQKVDAAFDLGVFRDGRIELVEDFPAFDRTGDGVLDDDDLLFAVTLRSGRPDRDLEIPDADNVHVAGYVQDDWRVRSDLSVNAGLRYEIDTDVNNISRTDELNPLIVPFITEERRRDTNNLAPRLGFNWTPGGGGTSVRGGYGVFYDRVALQIQSLERGLDGRALPIEVRAGNLFFIDGTTGTVPPVAPSVSNPFTGFILPGEGASGINVIHPRLQNPRVQQVGVGIERQMGPRQVLRVDLVHNRGTSFLIGRDLGQVFNPVVGGPDRVVSLESSAKTQYSALLAEYERRYAGRYGLRASYTLSRAWNYANDDQIPFGEGPIDSNDLHREWGPTPNDRRHRLVLSGVGDLGGGFQLAGLWTVSSGVPMDILMPDGRHRVPVLSRNAGGRVFGSAADLNAFLASLNERGGIDGEPLPLVPAGARFSDSFSSLDLRLSRSFTIGRLRLDGFAEVFNLFNTANILGTSTANYSGFNNALVRDSNDPSDPGYLTSTRFGTPVSTAGGIFGSGGARALQLGARARW